jgi:O-antigen/teichoic acid export membrane protein
MALVLAAFDLLKQLDASYGILVIGSLSSETQAGYFRVALSSIVFAATPLSIFNVVLAPLLARLHSEGERERLQKLLTISAIVMFATTLTIFAILALFGKSLVVLVFGPSYAPSWVPLVLMTFAQAINGFFGVGWVFLSVSGGERMLTASFTTSVAVSIAVAVPLTILYGAAGAAGAAVVGALIQNILVWRGVRLHSSLESSAAGFLRRVRMLDEHAG